MPPSKPDVTYKEYFDLKFDNLERQFADIKSAIEKMTATNVARREFDAVKQCVEEDEAQLDNHEKRLLLIETVVSKDIIQKTLERINELEGVIKILKWSFGIMALIVVALIIEALKNLIW